MKESGMLALFRSQKLLPLEEHELEHSQNPYREKERQ